MDVPIRLRFGDLPEHEIGTLTIRPGETVHEAVAAALRAAADVIGSVPKLTAPTALPRRPAGARPHGAILDEVHPGADVIDMATGARLTGPAADTVVRGFLTGLRRSDS